MTTTRNNKNMNKMVLLEHDDHKYGDPEPKPFICAGLDPLQYCYILHIGNHYFLRLVIDCPLFYV